LQYSPDRAGDRHAVHGGREVPQSGRQGRLSQAACRPRPARRADVRRELRQRRPRPLLPAHGDRRRDAVPALDRRLAGGGRIRGRARRRRQDHPGGAGAAAVTDSTAGYAHEAPNLLERYEKISVEDLHKPFWHLIPKTSSRFVDIGAGTGRDAAAFAAMGHQVVAVEPVDALREGAKTLHPSPRIEWLADGLPALAVLRARGETFD